MATRTPTLQKIVSLGPIKAEIVWFDATVSASQVDTGDDFKYLLQRPLFAFGSETEEANSNNMTVALTAATKTATMTQTGLSADSCFVILVGF
jgi:hypothetical protein